MAGFGLVLGGAAEGFGKGVKLAKDYDEAKREEEITQGQRNAEAINQKLGLPGTMVPQDYSVETAANDALAAAKPQPSIFERMGQTVVRALRPHEAAIAAGVTPPPTTTVPATGLPTDSSTSAPDATMDTTTVTAPKLPSQRPLTAAEYMRGRLAAAMQLRGPEAAKAQEEAWNGVKAAEQDQLLDDITKAQSNPHALANLYYKVTGHDGDFEQTKDGKYVFRDADGTQVGGAYDSPAQFAAEYITPLAKHNPDAGIAAASKLSEERRADAELKSNIAYRGALARAAQLQAAAAATNAKTNASEGGARTALMGQQTRQLKNANDVVERWSTALEDTSKNAMTDDTLSRLAPQVAALDKDHDYYKGDPILDKDGVTVIGYKSGSRAADAVEARLKRDQAIYNATPEVKAGQVGYDPKTRRFLVRTPNGNVAGQNGQPYQFTDLDQAAYFARKLWNAKPAGK